MVCQKMPKSHFQSQFLLSKINRIFSSVEKWFQKSGSANSDFFLVNHFSPTIFLEPDFSNQISQTRFLRTAKIEGAELKGYCLKILFDIGSWAPIKMSKKTASVCRIVGWLAVQCLYYPQSATILVRSLQFTAKSIYLVTFQVSVVEFRSWAPIKVEQNE